MSQTRVLSVRFTEDEYQALQAMSLITGQPVNVLVRESVNEKADRAAHDPELAKMAEETKERIEAADKVLRDRVLAGRATGD